MKNLHEIPVDRQELGQWRQWRIRLKEGRVAIVTEYMAPHYSGSIDLYVHDERGVHEQPPMFKNGYLSKALDELHEVQNMLNRLEKFSWSGLAAKSAKAGREADEARKRWAAIEARIEAANI